MWWLVRYSLRILMPATSVLPGLSDKELKPFLKHFREEMPFKLRFALVFMTLVFIFTPLFTLGIPLPLFCLSQTKQWLHANKLSTHRIYLFRQSVSLLKIIASMCWGALPHAQVAITMMRGTTIKIHDERFA